MIRRLHLSAIILLAALIWAVLLIIDGVAVSIAWLRPFSTVVGVLLILLALFDVWLWRLPFLRGWFVKRPDIRGTWDVTIQSDWVDPATGTTIEPIVGYMAIRQTYSSLSLRLMTPESTSQLTGAEILSLPDGTFNIVGIYRSEPKLSVRQRSPIHNGAIILHVADLPATTLKGHYWTDRKTSGEIELKNRRGKVYNDYETARHH